MGGVTRGGGGGEGGSGGLGEGGRGVVAGPGGGGLGGGGPGGGGPVWGRSAVGAKNFAFCFSFPDPFFNFLKLFKFFRGLVSVVWAF